LTNENHIHGKTHLTLIFVPYSCWNNASAIIIKVYYEVCFNSTTGYFFVENNFIWKCMTESQFFFLILQFEHIVLQFDKHY